MANSPADQPLSALKPTNPRMARDARLNGKRVAMVTYSAYPDDPRPRRAIDALRGEGMTDDLICLGSRSSQQREAAKDLKVFRVPMKHRRGGKLTYAFQYGSFILI